MIANLKPYQTYKDSGVEWLGEVPGHWEVRQLGQFGTLSKGNGGNKADEVPSGIPCVRYGDLYTTHTNFIWKSRSFISQEKATDYTPLRFGDVLFAASGETIEEIGKSAVNLIPTDACCGGDIILFRPKRRVDAQFLGYATDCRPVAIQKSTMGRGITVKHIYGNQLKYVTLPLPSWSEQTAIVRFLDHADRRIRRYIRAKERLIELLEEQKQAIIHQAVTGQIDVRTGQPYPAYKDSGVEWLGKVPEHWEVRRLGQLIDLTVGFPFKSDGFTQARSDVRLLRGVNVAPGTLRWDDVVRWPIRDVDSFEGYEMEVGDIVLGMDRPIIQSGTRVAVVSESDVPSLLLQRVARIRVKEALRGDYAVELIGGKGFSDYLAPIFTGISVPHLSAEQVKNYRFALPNVSEQQAIMHHVASGTRSIRSAARRILQQIHLLREYRTRLIADVVTGELDVRDAAEHLPEAAPVAGGNQVGTIQAESIAHAIEHDVAKEAIS